MEEDALIWLVDRKMDALSIQPDQPDCFDQSTFNC